MKLLRLHVSSFGNLHEREFDFAEGITVLLGRNEAGKSTVLYCLSQLLYGKPSQRTLFPDVTPWAGGEFAADLTIEHGGTLYRLTRRFSEAGSRAVSLCRLLEDGTEQLVTREAAEVRNWVADALGTADDRIFYRVFCLSQADLNPLDNYSGLREQLERVASGAEVAVTAAVQRVDDRLAALRRGVSSPALKQNWGSLKRASEERREWEGRLQEARRQQNQLTEVREQMQKLQVSIESATARIAEVSGLLEQERNRQELSSRLTGLRTEWDNFEQSRERIAGLTADCNRLRQRTVSVPPAYASLEEARARLNAVKESKGSLAISYWVLSLLFVLGIAVIIIAGITKSISLGICAVAGILVGLLLLLRQFSAKMTLTRLLSEFGVSQLADALKRLDELEKERQELSALEKACEAVSGAGADENRRRELTREMAVLEEKIAQIPGKPLTAEEGHRWNAELQSLQKSLPEWQGQERSLLRESAVLEDAERDLVELEDGAEYWRQEEARAREEEQTLALARELLLQAGEQAHGSIADPLSVRITPLFAAMTSGRYPQVQVAGDANTFEAHPLDAAGTPIPPDQLSKGTKDQFILAVRLALGQVIAGEEGSPLFLLDEPLLHFDEERRKEALAALTELASSIQIILATHEESLVPYLHDAKVVRLSMSPMGGRDSVEPQISPLGDS